MQQTNAMQSSAKQVKECTKTFTNEVRVSLMRSLLDRAHGSTKHQMTNTLGGLDSLSMNPTPRQRQNLKRADMKLQTCIQQDKRSLLS